MEFLLKGNYFVHKYCHVVNDDRPVLAVCLRKGWGKMLHLDQGSENILQNAEKQKGN